MYKGKSVLGIILARGGSKGLPNKNIMPLCGHPLIAWSIRCAQASRYIDKVLVSTDSAAIASAARRYAADVPFLRPKRLSNDSASSVEALAHALRWLERGGETFDALVLLQPTSPLRLPLDIDAALRKLYLPGVQAVVSVCRSEHPHWWMNVLPADGNMAHFIHPRARHANRQRLPESYRLNGAVYAARWKYFLRAKSFFGPGTYACKMPAQRSVDIDTAEDFARAQFRMEENKGSYGYVALHKDHPPAGYKRA
ncbi:MAG TPA: acylneuraminate cytidylyltransferase family protein [Candidatus Omnitrophota bacterium]|nr:acylneuraminate cytidylyltransferase family protein [Candidatus Omnitrophota bacterium]HRZ15543.1 acylneuraminate cytidylyltransferase family protein [Candidatus Omnitrophota bacterium]